MWHVLRGVSFDLQQLRARESVREQLRARESVRERERARESARKRERARESERERARARASAREGGRESERAGEQIERATRPNGEWGFSTRRQCWDECPAAVSPTRGVVLTDLQSSI